MAITFYILQLFEIRVRVMQSTMTFIVSNTPHGAGNGAE